jgi:HopA1 effector protein family
MSIYRDQVTAAVSAVTIRSPTGYAWLGHPSRPLPRSVRDELSGLECRRHLVASLREELYSSFYSTGGPVPARWGKAQPVAADPRLRTSLSDANARGGSWEPAWIADSYDGEEAVVSTPRLRVRVPAADCRTDDGGPIRPGVAVSVRLPTELPALSPGFFMVLGAVEFEALASRGTLRVYWHITASGAPALVRALSSRLNAETVPFRLKVADHPVRFDRCDAAVLYLPIEAFDGVRGMLAHVAATLTSRLRPKTPAFTLALAPGVGLAESPATGESFGEHRCGLLADGIVDADEQGVAPGAARVEAVIASLGANGVQIDAPYLELSLDGRHVL